MEDVILEIISIAIKQPSHIRKGQAIFNATYGLFPDIADSLRGTSYDCFYLDANIAAFLDKVKEKIL